MCFPKRSSNPCFTPDALVVLMAWYLSDGSVTPNAVEFTLGAAELDNIQSVCSAAASLGLNARTADDTKSNTVKIFVSSVALRNMLAQSCGVGSHYKRIPFEMIGGKEALFLDTLLKGDGYVHGKTATYSTTSQHLAFGVQQLAIMLGYRAGISQYYNRPSKIGGRTINSKYDIWKIRWCIEPETPTKYSNRLRMAKYCMHAAVRSATKEHYKGKVYNLAVQYDESFVANGILVHNCSFDAALKGAYFGEQMNDAVNDGRISSNIVHRPDLPVMTAWDLGMGDTMVIVFAQCVDERINIIDCISASGKTLDYYIREVQKDRITIRSISDPMTLLLETLQQEVD